jgi:hypothetical protein
MGRWSTTLLTLVLAAAPAGVAAQEPPWELVATGDITIRSRPRPGTAVREIWAEGKMGAEVQDIQATLMGPEQFPRFMPYVSEARVLGSAPDGARLVYTRLDLPWLAPRDYVLKVYLDSGVAPDGSGVFRNHWVAHPDHMPARSNIVRLRINDGSWHVTSNGDGTSHAIYKFAVDPGGMIPGFAANMGNKSGVSDTFTAVEKEAKRRGVERRTRADKK